MPAVNSPARKSKHLYFSSIALLFAVTAGCASSAERPFSFPESLYYMDDDDALASVQAFIAAQLPAGLSKVQAVARLTRAGMNCGRPTASSTTNCSYWRSTVDKWTIKVKLDDRGAVSTARVDHERIGVDPN